jgi:hypothetical protein
MAFKPFVQIRMGPDEEVTSKHINLVQNSVSEALSQLLGKDALDETIVENVKLNPSGINYVNHTLGRTMQGVDVVRQHGTGTFIQVWDVQDANTAANAKLQAYMMASSTGTFNLRFF